MSNGEISGGKRRLFIAVLVLLALAAAELASWAVMTWSLPRFEAVRRRMMGGAVATFMRCVGQPYLLYVPTPNYMVEGRLEHNEQGYRGPAVPMRRTPGVARILCLGESTTYGWGAERAEQAYPAQLQEILKRNLPAGVSGLEVINAGLPYGTTAEMLTHYHFKFHYYKPDLVIIHTGGNDAEGITGAYYQPDYSHWRQELGAVKPLPSHSRWLMRSRLASLVTIWLLHGTRTDRAAGLIRPEDLPPVTRWYPELGPMAGTGRDVPREEWAFFHNLRALLKAIQDDGGKVLLVPFQPAPVNNYPAAVHRAFKRSEAVLKELADERKLEVVPFRTEMISPSNWVDSCHLNAAGEREKAQIIAPCARRALWP